MTDTLSLGVKVDSRQANDFFKTLNKLKIAVKETKDGIKDFDATTKKMGSGAKGFSTAVTNAGTSLTAVGTKATAASAKMDAFGTSAAKTATDIASIDSGLAATTSALAAINATLVKTASAMTKVRSAAGPTQAQFDRLSQQVRRLREQLGDVVPAANNAGNAVDKTGRQAQRAAGKMSKGSQRVNAFGLQLQDVAVQAQMGTDALVIFGQQGPQLAGVFGPTGAVIGALAAVGAAITGFIIKTAGAGADKLKELQVSAVELANDLPKVTTANIAAGAIEELRRENERYANALLDGSRKMVSQRAELRKLQAELAAEERMQRESIETKKKTSNQYQFLTRKLREMTEAGKQGTPEFIKLQAAIAKFDKQFSEDLITKTDNLKKRIKLLTGDITILAGQLDVAADATDKNAKQQGKLFEILERFRRGEGPLTEKDVQLLEGNKRGVEQLITTWTTQTKVMGKNAEQQREYAMSLLLLTPTQKEQLSLLNEEISAIERKLELEKTNKANAANRVKSIRSLRDLIMTESEATEAQVTKLKDLASSLGAHEIAMFEGVAHSKAEIEERLQAKIREMRAATQNEEMIKARESLGMLETLSSAGIGLAQSLMSAKQTSLRAEAKAAGDLTEKEIAFRERAAREAFEAEKKFSIGAIAVNTSLAVIKALTDNLPFAARFANAAAAAATGASAAIKANAQQFGGLGLSAAQPVAPQQNITQTQNVEVNVISNDPQGAVEAVKAATANGEIIFGNDTKQARALARG